MKILALITFISLSAISQDTGQYVSRLDNSLAENYKESTCYKEFNGVYSDAVKSSINQLKFKQQVAYQYGVTLSGGNSSSDWGKSERSIANAADYQSDSSSSYTLNDFHEIHSKAQKKFPEITKDQTQLLIRKGFQSGRFCDHWFFSSRYNKKQVAKYVKKEFELYLEEEQGRRPAISDSEIPKEELDQEMNQELQYNDAGVIDN